MEPPGLAAAYNWPKKAQNMNDSGTKDDLVRVVVDSLKAIRPDADTVFGADTQLVGPQAVLDSVGLVTLLVALEESLDNSVDLSASFLEPDDSEDGPDPFSTVGSLADHISGLVAGRDAR
jgi:acyl carrier protein